MDAQRLRQPERLYHLVGPPDALLIAAQPHPQARRVAALLDAQLQHQRPQVVAADLLAARVLPRQLILRKERFDRRARVRCRGLAYTASIRP